jgi:hypothetical protein
MGDLRGRDQAPLGQGPLGPAQGPPSQGQGRDGVFQVSDTNSSSSSDPVNGALNTEFLRNLLSLSSAPAPGSVNTNVNAELLRRILSSGQPATTVSIPPAVESVESALRREILRIMGGPEQNAQSNPLNGLILNSISQLQANSGPFSGPTNRPNSGPNSGMNNDPVNGASRGPNNVPQTTADLSPEELHIVSLMRRKNAALQNTSSIPERTTMHNIEQQLTMLIQQHQAQQARASTAADALHPASRETTNVRAGQELAQQPSLEHLQLPSHLQSGGLRLPDGFLQLQRQRQLQDLVQPYQQPTLENLQHQPQGKSDRAMLPDGLLQAQQQSQGFPSLTGQQPSRQLRMEHLQQYHHLQQNDGAVLPDTHLQTPPDRSPFLSLAEDAAMPPARSTEPTAASDSGAPTPRRARQRKKEAFPGKLYRLLADAESRGNSHIISFTPDGNSFKIHNPDAFMKELAPNYFDQTHFTSFVRQLNLYGFDRVSHGHDRGAFIHPSFIRGHGDLASRIQRQIVPPRAKK